MAGPKCRTLPRTTSATLRPPTLCFHRRPGRGIVVYDGYGSFGPGGRSEGQARRETVSLFLFTEEGCERIGGAFGASRTEDDDFPLCVNNSVGMFYEMITGLLGYTPMDVGKTMGLAAFGLPRHVEAFEKHIDYTSDPADCFRCDLGDPRLMQAVERALVDGGGGFAARADVAASAQRVVDRALAHFAGFFDALSVDVLAVSGGLRPKLAG